MKSIGLLVGAVVLVSYAGGVRAENPVIVHEWGTFTSLQDENGQAIGGINVDDEPVPSFVYGIGGVRAIDRSPFDPGFGFPPYFSGKGWMPGDQEVTMRLETPVIYFYPPKGDSPESIPPLQVHVNFHGGILSQFYPYAIMSGLPGNPPGAQTHTILRDMRMADVTSRLNWKDVQLGSAAKPVAIDDKVWTTPREVGASLVEIKKPIAYADNGTVAQTTPEAEHFLFYRGIGHVDSPLRQGWSVKGEVGARTNYSFQKRDLKDRYSEAWFVDIKGNGTCAFQSAINASSRFIATSFYDQEFSAENLGKLKASMQDALVKNGLYPDEASAMLRTWELSYFKSPGLRFFYIAPRAWVEQELPLYISGAPVEITRVMVGRIELISDEEKAALVRLAKGPYPDLVGLKKHVQEAIDNGKFSEQERQEFYTGARPLTDLGISLSPSVCDYLSLGRFRDALIVHEQQTHPSDNLARFIQENGLASAR